METRQLVRLFSALGNEVRLRIVDLVSANGEMCVCELVDALRLSQANISRHVGILRDAGVLSDRKVGTWVLLRVEETALQAGPEGLLDRVQTNHARSVGQDAEARLQGRCSQVAVV